MGDGRHRARKAGGNRGRTLVVGALAGLGVLGAGYVFVHSGETRTSGTSLGLASGHSGHSAHSDDAPDNSSGRSGSSGHIMTPVVHQPPQQLPGLGPGMLARIPADTRQAVVVTGVGKDSPDSRLVLYRRTADGWQAQVSWAAHNARNGWTTDHHLNDLRSPVGVYTLTDAGGRMPDPGSKLPYARNRSAFAVGGTGFRGESLAGSFNYVVAINYNRHTGVPPYDWARPEGAGKGGGIWIHVDHGGPTHACVSIAQEHMKTLLRTLDPSLHPIIVMGDNASLAE
ncbi:L,D-transpeptidase family protein [Streptomyces sp. NPDC086787]|uniref:L,D-transpeptidase family protein n=1 Tax=Streptomyces sp. NPDC086787 TaxID=3365759 RepID=UPI003803D351